MVRLKTSAEYGNTERRPCHFVIRQYSDGTWIAVLEAENDELNVLRGGILALEALDGLSREKVQEFVDLLNDNVKGVSFTHIPSNP